MGLVVAQLQYAAVCHPDHRIFAGGQCDRIGMKAEWNVGHFDVLRFKQRTPQYGGESGSENQIANRQSKIANEERFSRANRGFPYAASF